MPNGLKLFTAVIYACS